jgi:hypothetical protein
LTPGVIYTFVVYDITTECYFLKESNAIPSNSTLKINIDSISNIKCKGTVFDGKVTFTVSDFGSGATGFNYQLFKAQTNSAVGLVQNKNLSGSVSFTEELSNLEKGLYYIVFEGIGGPSNGCKVASSVFEIKESLLPLDLTPTVIKKANFYFGYSYQITLSQIAAYNSGTHMVTLGFDFLQGISDCPCTQSPVHD